VTDLGRTRLEEVGLARRRFLRALLADWTPEDRAELGRLLGKLRQGLLGRGRTV
jgi:DNA-binding MarR family transcriptional regulator